MLVVRACAFSRKKIFIGPFFLTLMHQLFFFSNIFYYKILRVCVSCRRNLFAQLFISGLLTATKRMRYNYKTGYFYSYLLVAVFLGTVEVCARITLASTRSQSDRIFVVVCLVESAKTSKW